MFEVKIPERWQKMMLFQVATEQKISNKNVHHQNLLSLSYGKIKRKDINTHGGLLPNSFDTYQIVHDGNIILRLTDLQNDHKSLRVGLVTETGIITSAYTCLKPRENILPSFLYFVLHAYDIKKFFYGMGGGVRQSIGYSDIRKIFLPVPPLDEQEKIVRYLDKKTSDMTKFIDAKKKQVELLKELKRSIISDAVTNGLYNDSSQWQKIKLKYVAKLNPNRKKIFLLEDKLSYVPMECVKAGYLIPKEISFKDLISGLTYFEDGDIIFAKVTPCFENGNIAIAENLLNGAAYGSSELFVLKCFDIYKKFLFYFLQSSDFKNECIANMTGTAGLKRVPSKIVMNYKIPLPSLWIQKEIADYLDVECTKIENLIEAIQKEISLVEELRKSLISEVVTGKIDVRELI